MVVDEQAIAAIVSAVESLGGEKIGQAPELAITSVDDVLVACIAWADELLRQMIHYEVMIKPEMAVTAEQQGVWLVQ